MFLKSISLAGFKSFGTRTTMELGPGITVVVGPNGSGKSNIVEAVAWATGGLSTRGLRADRTEELLFCGASGLPPASRAEVTLVFDNSSGLLPIDRPEVAITRRHYRSGESRFEINRTPCRLMDITELLAEAGLRRSRFAILGQGQVEQVLNASPTEHRQVLEEAAGVGKHLWRRDRAIRRLGAARSDLERIGERIADGQRRLRPLARQAEALEYRSRLVEEVKSLRVYLEGENLRDIEERLDSVSERRRRWEAVRSEAIGRREQHLESLEAIESARQDLQSEAGGDLLRDWEMVLEKMKRLSEVAALRSQAHQQQLRTRRRLQRLSAERVALHEGLGELDGARSSAEAEIERCRLEYARLTDLQKEIMARIDTSAEAEMGVVGAERSALRAVAGRDSRERESIETRLAALAPRTEEIESREVSARVRHAEQQAAAEEAAAAIRIVEAEAAEKKQALREAERLVASAQSAMADALGRLEATRGAVGGGPEQRRRLESLTGWAGWVTDLVESPPELAAAMAAGLQVWGLAGAFEGPVALGAALENLGGDSDIEGPVSMVSTRFPAATESSARTVAASGSKVTPLVDLLDGRKRSSLAVRLLGDVVLVEDWRVGWEVVGNHPQLRAVTVGGDLITARGIRLGRGNRLPDLAAARAEAQAAADAWEARREEARSLSRQADLLGSRCESRLGDLQDLRRRMLRFQQDSERLAARLAEMRREEDRLQNRLRSLAEAERARNRRLDELTGRIRGLQARADGADESENLARRMEEVSKARTAMEEERRAAEAALIGLVERRKLEGARYEQVVVELSEVSLLPDNGTPGYVEEVAEMAATALGLMSTRTAFFRNPVRSARRRARALAEESTDTRKAMERADRRAREATLELEGLIAEVSRLEARRQTSLETLWEMGADPARAAEAPRPEVDDPKGALASAVTQLERLKPTNPYAASDLSRLQEELSELCEQRDDIVRSDRRLRQLISRLEKEATERYLATFRETAKAFGHTFGQLFPGGRGRLSITDPADPLGSGVEISARPEGKRVNRLSLLSGGERALGALAFLFALMQTRPAPFYLLDEMDASLDAANLYRVLESVRQLRSHAQILIITHQPQTAEFGDVLYGVTLPPGGATQVVSRRLKPSKSQAQSAHPRAKSA